MPDSDQRRFPRFPINFVLFPVLISAPGLTDLTLDPHDISMGGFKVLLPEEPEVGSTFTSSIELRGKTYPECKVRVAWTHKNNTQPPSWSTGLALLLPGPGEEFQGRLNQVLTEVGKAPA
ncbi:MAG: PilZ domain-containing protein [Candidatus Tectomicrobia bacterium]|uniref:PilZ domain-containing protein n=1 Tax=Tectimicrobiota bacterium TaxID=2528274 RepID=A0A932I107_UNCTE|nr:PilZ domain-containing protein [Candidatus Tectomicrobia bacterium]